MQPELFATHILSSPEQQRFAGHEAAIEHGLQTFVSVGNALLAIRDDRLYRQDYATFEDYCRERWNIERRRAYQLMDAAAIVNNIAPDVKNFTHRESHVAPLTHLDPADQREVWQEAIETAPNGKMTAAHMQSVVNEHSQGPDEYDGDEWYTPVEFIEAAREVMGSIDLDPASCDEAQKIVQATTYYTQNVDGLVQEWTAKNVWLNPPYSTPRPWVEKAIESLEAGTIECAILLVNTANSPLWTRPLWHGPYAVCLLERRVRFWRPDRPSAKGFDRDQMIWYLGCDVDKFRSIFASYGAIR